MLGKVIAVTGASSGIGRAIALSAAQAGANVALCGRDAKKLSAVTKQLRGQGSRCFTFDSEDPGSIAECAAGINESMGPVSGFVHSAGVSSIQLLRDLNFAKASEMLQINYLAFLAFAKEFCRRGRYEPGFSVVAISSLAGVSPDPGLAAYAGSKAALNAAVSALAKEYAPRGIRFNTICPGFVDTPMNDKLKAAIGDEAFRERVKKSMPLGMIEPDDVAESALFLLSEASRRITGVRLVMDSGGGGIA